MTPAVRVVFVVHDHQPVGNFDGVFEGAYRDAYAPFLDLLERHPQVRVAIHTSGPLAEWLDERHPAYLDRLAALAAAGRVEIVGGAFYEPVLAMLPGRDRVGQILRYREWLERRLATRVTGLWPAERVWDPGMAADLVRAGVEWTILDDTHFKAAGLPDERLDRPWITEGDGGTLAVLPVSERLRYLIPFAAPEDALHHLRFLGERRPGALAIFGDDGEKFGVWPGTAGMCLETGWMERFLRLVAAAPGVVEWCLPSEVVRGADVSGPVWLPECSYREMTEWVLPPAAQRRCVAARRDAAHDPRLAAVAPFLRGGSWRNFRHRYAEAAEMYARAMAVSDRAERVRGRVGDDDPVLDAALRALYRGQCNCAYWHGAFGGIYLPHLRNAIYRELIEADVLLDRLEPPAAAAAVEVRDWDFDGRPEVRVSTSQLDAWLAPARGGIVYELDLRDWRHNVLATLDRREEAYHAEVLAGPGGAASVVDGSRPATFKEAGLEELVRVDAARRKMFVDHFWDLDVDPAAVAAGSAAERGDFAVGAYEHALHRAPDRVEVELTREGNVWGIPLRLAKRVVVRAGVAGIEAAYELSGLPPGFRQQLAVEVNLAGLPAAAPGRFFRDDEGRALGELGSRQDLPGATSLGLVDDWLGIEAVVTVDGGAAGMWAFPVRTVSQSEGGFEGVHQSVAVMPRWIVEPDGEGRWRGFVRVAFARYP
ncbi:MAG: alpha-amylase/4-alpha-glucanotransferase domain-containing protein [Planctomycetaceae bacterium]